MCANINNSPDFITLASFPRAICHIDCDAFFTSCEQARNPHLKAVPLATGQERGIVSCPSYAAKKAGVKRAMRIGEAKRVCPQLVVLPSDYELYSIYSERMFAIIRRFTPTVEEYSIDEAFCDLTGLRRLYRSSYAEIARLIKQTIARELGITVSVGLSLSKTLAKICSKQQKPDGFVAVAGNQLHEFLATVPLDRVCGFGPNTVALL
ncbi:MAG: DNA polymerase IV, partial [Candidatus Omnitrophica bacterium]|nr:DNA polymerase IV [Candidatus Omnitrophota bacterium]